MRGGPGGEGGPIAPDGRPADFFFALFGVFFGFFFRCRFRCRFLCALERLQDGSGAQHGPNLGRFWSHVGASLEHFWVLFCSLHLRYIGKRFLIDFSSIFDPSEAQKTLKKQWFFNIFAFLPCSLLRPFLDRLWVDFGAQNRPKIGPESVFIADENHDRFSMPS